MVAPAVRRRARRHANLHERNVPAQLRTAAKHLVERGQALGYALRVIQTVDANPNDVGAQIEQLPQPILFDSQCRIGGNGLDPIVVHANRNGNDRAVAIAKSHAGRLRLDLGAELVLHRQEKVTAIALELKRQQVVREQTGEKLARPRADAEAIRVWPRNVPEEGGACSRAPAAERRRYERQVIILNEDGRVRGADLLIDGPKRAKQSIALAHGAGAAMDSEFMEFFAKGLAKEGFRVVRFEFPYMAERRKSGTSKPPDREPVLRETWLRVIASLGAENLLIGGKSMGGRIASLIADEAGVAGLVCLGYPFHPTGKPEKL